MTHFFSFVTLLVIFAEFSNCAPTDKPQCSPEEKRRVDVIFTRNFILGNDDLTIPLNVPAAKPLCSELKSAPKKLRRHIKDCYDPLTQQIATLLLGGVKKNLKAVCGTDTKLQSFLDKALCYNANITIGHQCMYKFILDLQAVNKQPVERKLPLVCCSYYKLRACVIDAGTECDEKGIKEIKAFIDRYTDDALQLACSATPESSPACKQPFENTETKKESYGVFVPLMDIFSTLGSI